MDAVAARRAVPTWRSSPRIERPFFQFRKLYLRD
jgi:hypothetical protein